MKAVAKLALGVLIGWLGGRYGMLLFFRAAMTFNSKYGPESLGMAEAFFMVVGSWAGAFLGLTTALLALTLPAREPRGGPTEELDRRD